MVSNDSARDEYGVILDGSGSVDQDATESGREELRGQRGELLDFDHGPLPSLEEQRANIAETRRSFNEWLSGELGVG